MLSAECPKITGQSYCPLKLFLSYLESTSDGPVADLHNIDPAVTLRNSAHWRGATVSRSPWFLLVGLTSLHAARCGLSDLSEPMVMTAQRRVRHRGS
jgi:hypothetical protein